jgi:hypothetical protein
MSFTSNNMTRNAFSMLDMMMNMQRLSIQAMTSFQPLASTFLTSAKAAERAAQPFFAAAQRRGAELGDVRGANEERVIGVGEEILTVGTRMVPGKTTRVRRVVV